MLSRLVKTGGLAMGKAMDRLKAWALTVNTGQTFEPEEPGPVDFVASSRKEPPLRTRQSMIGYARARNNKRFERLQKDYAWLRRMMAEMGMNPDDAKFLL